ncbi:MAM domain-containing glycosylphosphatidylinositol anchor protein 1-like [Exaiptasia diaphana]|nr:MAM domain-containing glycosylphosphatidylinositol anchor protein 1-like [Exaiptasia diaphana]
MYLDVPRNVCMSFFYHMYGNGIGALKIITRHKISNKVQVIWSRQGNQGDNWLQEDGILINGEDGVQVVIEGVIGKNYSGDIAIDEVGFRQGYCPSESQND